MTADTGLADTDLLYLLTYLGTQLGCLAKGKTRTLEHHQAASFNSSKESYSYHSAISVAGLGGAAYEGVCLKGIICRGNGEMRLDFALCTIQHRYSHTGEQSV